MVYPAKFFAMLYSLGIALLSRKRFRLFANIYFTDRVLLIFAMYCECIIIIDMLDVVKLHHTAI